MKVTCTNWPGDGPEYAEELELLIRGSFLGKFEETSWGPSSIFTEVDGYLYNFFHTGQPNNRSHVSDTPLDVILDAQRRYTARSSRKKVIDDIQRYLADRSTTCTRRTRRTCRRWRHGSRTTARRIPSTVGPRSRWCGSTVNSGTRWPGTR